MILTEARRIVGDIRPLLSPGAGFFLLGTGGEGPVMVVAFDDQARSIRSGLRRSRLRLRSGHRGRLHSRTGQPRSAAPGTARRERTEIALGQREGKAAI